MRKKQGFSTLPLDSLNFDTKISRYITNHLDGRYGELHAIFLYGSYVNGFANETSDVDIICISKKNISPFHEKFEVFGLLFDAFVYDAESLNGAILISRASRIYPLIFSLSKSIIIPEASKVAKSLKDVATIVWARRQIGITFKLDINILSNLIDDLKHESNKLCLFTVCTKTYEHLIDMQLRSLGYGGFSGKTAARELHSTQPEWFESINLALQLALSGNTLYLVREAEKVLNRYSNHQRNTFKMSMPESLRVPLIQLDEALFDT